MENTPLQFLMLDDNGCRRPVMRADNIVICPHNWTATFLAQAYTTPLS